jgi:hypothetical protein
MKTTEFLSSLRSRDIKVWDHDRAIRILMRYFQSQHLDSPFPSDIGLSQA